MEQDDSYAWNRTTVMAGICESLANFPPAIQTPQHSCTSGPANFFALQISLITFKLQGDPPKKKKKKRSIYVRGEEGIKSLKGTPSLEEGLGKKE
jgi:hypothetical protein